MNKSMKPSAAAQRPLTEEEKKSQIMRAFMQKKASLAEGIIFNLIQACGRDLCYDLENNQTKDNPTKIVKMANDMADEFMRVVYGQEITYKETSEE
ncbi:MAG: hypothetical protein MJZ12_00500 [Prevotella sp.]|nr:hypothetical protein [Prevotella sp.]